MSRPLDLTPGLLTWSLLWDQRFLGEDKIQSLISKNLGETLNLKLAAETMQKYYSKEMGEDCELIRSFHISLEPVPRDALVAAKLESLKLEDHYAIEGRRRINIDPGFLSLENFQLSTFKPFTHRIYLSQGVFSDLTYIFKNKGLEILPWTYPEYHQDELKKFYLAGREHLLRGHREKIT